MPRPPFLLHGQVRRLMRRSFLGAGALVSCGISAATAQTFGPCATETTAPAAIETALDAILMQAVEPIPELKALIGAAPGAVLSVTGPGWRYVKSAGVADPETNTALDCAAPFEIGSNTKMMTAVVLLQMVEEGRLGIDDPLSKHLPEIAAQLPNGAEMTLHQLAQHVSGVYSYTDDLPDGTPGLMSEKNLTDTAVVTTAFTPEEIVQFVIDRGTPNFAPGEAGQWHYSNTGYILLGMVIEKVDGRSLEESFKARIFDPLGMSETFLWNDSPKPDFGLPRGYFDADHQIETTDWNLSQGWAAGGVISTPDDMHRFIEGLFGQRLFKSPDTLSLMQKTVPTAMDTMAHYGIGIGEKQDGVWGHGGQTLGFESDVAILPDQQISMVGWGNSANNFMVVGAMSVAGAVNTVTAEVNETQADLRDALTGNTWQLESLRSVDGPTKTVADPEAYTVTFQTDGTVAIGADCNRVLASWDAAGGSLTINPGPATMALCPPGSLSEAFVAALTGTLDAALSMDSLTLRGATTELKLRRTG
jgi:D-alanyl-D-alanine carboxypeptidase